MGSGRSLGAFGSGDTGNIFWNCAEVTFFTMFDLENESWWSYLDESEQELLKESFLLLEREEKNNDHWHDYSFVVFPAAKAYEGFLKKLFLDMGFLTKEQYEGDRFRVGRALNPSLEREFRGESIYDMLKEKCSPNLPDRLWETWKFSRNLLFHWFPWHKNATDLKEARERVEAVVGAIREAVAGCRIGERKAEQG